MASLAGKAFVLTGGASGIGLATARVLASKGASLYIGDSNLEALKASLPSISQLAVNGELIKTAKLDVRDRADVRAFLQKAKAEFGELHGAANIAGITGKGMGVSKIWELDTEEYEQVMAVNAKGIFNCLAEELHPDMLKPGSSIVNMASINGLRANSGGSPYVASKHAVVGLTKSAAIEAGPREIRVNAVEP
ncbi:3-oxoacyl-[acyl-carrier- ] reductase [Pyrenophora seminiperda CCB06]|uniref:3-oxoacyl-[acyl-carrier-] reductase n=1 Tax=Pyrenophora seminiperda CCB06 TaxID=1302712 RepID=A0A3M7M1Q7_9PLEO|nr:3-oxoacyl-[acyl-carrier- ] reductase [Pyrenophora seminiperda CCB06]